MSFGPSRPGTSPSSSAVVIDPPTAGKVPEPKVAPRVVAAVVGLLLAACGKKAPIEPPEFGDPGRASTSNSVLERRITEGLAYAEVDGERVEALRQRVLAGVGEETALAEYAAIQVGRGHANDVLNLLHRRALASPGDEGKGADALAFAVAHHQWQLCADMAKDYLEIRLSGPAFLMRALCLERAGDLDGGRENFEAAQKVRPLDAAVVREFIKLAIERGSPSPMPPARDSEIETLRPYFSKQEVLDRLFFVTLTGRLDLGLSVTTFAPGGFSEAEAQEVILSRSRSYRHCFNLSDALGRRSGQLIGSAQVEWTVGPFGQVSGVKVSESAWGRHPGAEALDRCLVAQVQRLRFPRTRFGAEQPLRHRFVFQPI